MLLSIAN